MNIFEIFNMIELFQIFVISRSGTEILIEQNF